jgi:hypothetical protein
VLTIKQARSLPSFAMHSKFSNALKTISGPNGSQILILFTIFFVRVL